MRTLILNLDFKPLSTVDSTRGLSLVMNSPNVSVLEYYDAVIRSEHEEYLIPAVLLYNRFIKLPNRKTPTKRLVFSRDRYICQYCGLQMKDSNGTIDHVIPVSFFGSRVDANTWENMVASCRVCNYNKGNRTPGQAGMKLKRKPQVYKSIARVADPPKEWDGYI